MVLKSSGLYTILGLQLTRAIAANMSASFEE